MKNLAARAYSMGARGLFGLFFLGVLAGCSSTKPGANAAVYDFGPGMVTEQPSNRMAPLPPLALGEVQASVALDNLAVVYRLSYSDSQQLRPYAQARWSMPPAQLLRQRVREALGQRRAVVNLADGVLPAPGTLVLRLELEEFSQLFESADRSAAVLRLRATLAQVGNGGDSLVAQRSFVAQQPSTSADAPGGVRALTVATDAVVEQLEQWVQQTQASLPAR